MSSSRLPVTQPIPSKLVRQIRLFTRLGRLASRLWFLVRILNFIGYQLRVPKASAERYRLGVKYLALANNDSSDLEPLGYTGNQEVNAFLNYQDELSNPHRLATSESRALYESQLNLLSEILPQGTTKLLNFGVCYAHVDSILARQFPDIEFHGVDRSLVTKALNESEFSTIPNLRFFADDIFQHLKDYSYSGWLFFHSRTALLLSKSLLESIYASAYDAGFETIVGFEQIGLSRETLTPYTFSLQETPSVLFRQSMFIHNYPAILQKSGFQVERFSFLATSHPHPDFRIAAFTARRVSR